MGTILSVNLAVPEANSAKSVGVHGHQQTAGGLARPGASPGPQTTGLGIGPVGDQIFDLEHHGGDDQAVYVYAREDYDWWEADLARVLPGGMFGTTSPRSGLRREPCGHR